MASRSESSENIRNIPFAGTTVNFGSPIDISDGNQQKDDRELKDVKDKITRNTKWVRNLLVLFFVVAIAGGWHLINTYEHRMIPLPAKQRILGKIATSRSGNLVAFPDLCGDSAFWTVYYSDNGGKRFRQLANRFARPESLLTSKKKQYVDPNFISFSFAPDDSTLVINIEDSLIIKPFASDNCKTFSLSYIHLKASGIKDTTFPKSKFSFPNLSFIPNSDSMVVDYYKKYVTLLCYKKPDTAVVYTLSNEFLPVGREIKSVAFGKGVPRQSGWLLHDNNENIDIYERNLPLVFRDKIVNNGSFEIPESVYFNTIPTENKTRK